MKKQEARKTKHLRQEIRIPKDKRGICGRGDPFRIFFLFIWFWIVASSFPDSALAQEEAQAAAVLEHPSSEKRVTLELQGVNILDVLKLISKQSGLNIVAGRNVQGQVSIFLQEVPVRKALKMILESQGLASVEEEGVIKVMAEKDYLEKYGKPYEDRRITQTFHLRYAQAQGLASTLSQIKSPMGTILTEPRTNTLMITESPEILEEMEALIEESDLPQETRIFSLKYTDVESLEPKLKALVQEGQGHLEVDKRSNRIIVTDIPTRIEKIEKMIEGFDIRVPQVQIDAKIIEVRLSDQYRQGIDWNYLAEKLGDFDTWKATAPLLVGAPSGGTLTALALGSGEDNLKLVTQALNKIGKTNTLSAPRIVVMNNEEARLAVATREPFVSQTVVQTVNSSSTADNVQFVDVGVTLKVIPKISSDEYIVLKINPEVSTAGAPFELQGVAQGSNTTFTRTRIPVVTTQELETTILVKSGTTIVIGGLIQDRQEKQTAKVPLLGSIPLLGRAFQSKSHDFVKTELVSFLTPTILRPEEETREETRFFDPELKPLPFEEFGGSPYRATYWNPIRHARFGEIPYWTDDRGVSEEARYGNPPMTQSQGGNQ